MSVIVVTGAAGQLGRSTVQLLQSQGMLVHAYDRVSSESLPFSHTLVDLANPRSDFYWPEETETVLHLAGSRDIAGFSSAAAQEMLDSNLLSTATALAACGSHVRRFVYVSSMSVYAADAPVPTPESGPTDPVSLYAKSKWLGEQACHVFQTANSAFQLTIVRLAQVYGPGSPDHLAIYKLIDQALRTGCMYLDCMPDLKRDFIYLDDAAIALVYAVQTCPSGIYNIGGGKPVTMQELADIVAASVASPATVSFGMKRGTDRALAADAFRTITGFVPLISIQDGIARDVEWYSQKHNISRGKE